MGSTNYLNETKTYLLRFLISDQGLPLSAIADRLTIDIKSLGSYFSRKTVTIEDAKIIVDMLKLPPDILNRRTVDLLTDPPDEKSIPGDNQLILRTRGSTSPDSPPSSLEFTLPVDRHKIPELLKISAQLILGTDDDDSQT